MKDRLFIPLAVVSALTIVAVGLAPAFAERRGAPVEAVTDGDSLHFDVKAVSEIADARGFATMAPPGRMAGQEGVRVVADEALAPGATGKGARIALGPETRAKLRDRPLVVVMTARALPDAPATKAAFGLTSGGPVTWVQAPVGAEFAPVRFDLPAMEGAPLAIALWPASEGGGKGVEIKDIRIYGGAP